MQDSWFGNPPIQALLKDPKPRASKRQKLEARAALGRIRLRKKWRQWTRSLPARCRPLPPQQPALQASGWSAGPQPVNSHTRALRNRSQTAFHSLRIGIKGLLPVTSSKTFLPAEHKAWSNDLKEMQDVLGEVHDLDVLWSTAISCHIFLDSAFSEPAFSGKDSRQQSHKKILKEAHQTASTGYRKEDWWSALTLSGRSGAAALPQGKQIQELATRRMKLWAKGLDPDFAHSERLVGLALQLYDGLLASGWRPAVDAISARSSLLAAALLHDVEQSPKARRDIRKTSFDMIRAHGNPLELEAPTCSAPPS